LDGADRRLTMDELRGGLRVRARSWVGVVRLDSLEIRVVPKLAGGNLRLVEMIQFTTGLDALRQSVGHQHIATDGDCLFDLLALLLAQACERVIRRGVVADYLEHEDDLPVLRGRLVADRQIMERFGRVDRLICRFDERDHDIDDNRLLALALALAGRRARDQRVRARVRRSLRIFEDLCDPLRLDLSDGGPNITYDRLNEHYREAHSIARLILRGLSVSEVLQAGRTRCFAFLLDMNRLFELFVFRYLRHVLTADAYRVRRQQRDGSIIRHRDTGKTFSRVIPDVLVQRRSPGAWQQPVAVDAKYKLYDERKVSSGDIYQTFLYAYAYGGAAPSARPRSLLIYPTSGSQPSVLDLHVRSHAGRTGAEIKVAGLSIPDALDELRDGQPGEVGQMLREALAG